MTHLVVLFPPELDRDQLARLERAAPGLRVTVATYVESTETRNARVRGQAPPDPGPGPSRGVVEALATADVVLAWDVPPDLRALAPHLRWVQAITAGVDHYGGGDWDGVTVTTAAGVAAGPIAEFVMGRLLAVYKRFDELAELQRRHEWTASFGRVVEGRTMAVVGLGAIGTAVADRAAAFGMHVLGVRRDPRRPAPDSVAEVHGTDALPQVLARADAVVVCAPATAATRGLFGADAFAAMRRGAWFCNVSRGSLVDEDALVAALRSGRLGAAAIDVARHEPLPADSELWDTPNLHISPHSAASLERYMDSLIDLLADNLARDAGGEPLRNTVVPDPSRRPGGG